MGARLTSQFSTMCNSDLSSFNWWLVRQHSWEVHLGDTLGRRRSGCGKVHLGGKLGR